MKELFSIGETSKINNIPIRTLRYYDDIDLLKPTLINEETGYRYYSFHQFYLLDIIKYGKNLGLSLFDIKNMINSNNIDQMISLLKYQKEKAHEKIQELSTMLNNISSSIDNLEYVKSFSETKEPYTKYSDERYIISVKKENDISFDKLDMLLKDVVKDSRFQKYLTYKYGFLLDIESLKGGKINIISEFMVLREKPPFNDDRIMKIPSGEYLCYQDRVLSDVSDCKNIYSALNLENTSQEYLIADEMYMLNNWKNLLHEIKISI